ncbi:O-antigen polymerase [Shouchella clausii]|uniref:O-antigen polymerase n=1 Tax=Shouchella clausii TaxID=79880 RepID=UPI00226CDFEC|nr:O-antigen ligase [Shouchella clausii]
MRFWWLNPYKLLLYFLIPIYVVIYFVEFEGTVFFTTWYFLTGLLFLLALTLGSFFGQKIHIKRAKPAFVNRIYLDILFWLTLLAYVVWFREFILDPRLLVNMLFGDVRYTDIRNMIDTIPGITTMSQLGIVYVIFYMLQKDYYEKKVRRKYSFYLLVIICMTAFRAVAWSERLALIEIFLPIVVIYFANYKGVRFKRLLKAAPYVGVVLVFSLFSLTEYFRSWKSHYQYIYDDFLSFASQRLLNYYYTALNNGAGYFEISSEPSYKFEHTLDWLYNFPILGTWIEEAVRVNRDYTPFLRTYLTDEFNNPSGIFVYFYDMHVPLALLFICIVGVVLGLLYRGFATNEGIGVFIYPALYVGIIEVMRHPYLTSSRVFPVILFILIGVFAFRAKYVPEKIVATKNRKARKKYRLTW